MDNTMIKRVDSLLFYSCSYVLHASPIFTWIDRCGVCVCNDDDDAPRASLPFLTTCFCSLWGDDNVCVYHLEKNDEDGDGAREDTRSA